MTERSAATIAVGISNGISQRNFVYRKLDYFLGGLQNFSVVAINDSHDILRNYCEDRGLECKEKACRGIIDAKQILSKADSLLLFWNGSHLDELIFSAILLKIKYKVVPVPLTTVVNKDKNQEFDLYIGRGGAWGNPFPIKHGTSETREVVIERYRNYFEKEILGDPDKRQMLLALQGLRLGCHCKPLDCHGDIIANYLNAYLDEHG